MAVAPVRLLTCTAVADVAAVEPLPSSPKELSPQDQTVPSDFIACAVCPPLAEAIALTAVKLFTCTGERRAVVVPSPVSPPRSLARLSAIWRFRLKREGRS